MKCCVRINGFHTEWFEVKCGLKQGCSLSILWFNLYINIKAFNVDTDIGDEYISIILYVDDLTVIGKDEIEQWLLDELGKWCAETRLRVNGDKSKIVHFRSKSTELINCSFKCGETDLETVTRYIYLRLLLNEHLDYSIMARYVAKAGNRALGVITQKIKHLEAYHLGSSQNYMVQWYRLWSVMQLAYEVKTIFLYQRSPKSYAEILTQSRSLYPERCGSRWHGNSGNRL